MSRVTPTVGSMRSVTYRERGVTYRAGVDLVLSVTKVGLAPSVTKEFFREMCYQYCPGVQLVS